MEHIVRLQLILVSMSRQFVGTEYVKQEILISLSATVKMKEVLLMQVFMLMCFFLTTVAVLCAHLG